MRGRPGGVTALAVFFAAGACISGAASLALAFPGSALEPMWRLNPRAHAGFGRLGAWAAWLLLAVCVACGLAAAGLWRGRRGGYWLSCGLLAVNLAGDLANALLGTEPRALAGVPIAAGLLAYLASARVRRYFARPCPDADQATPRHDAPPP